MAGISILRRLLMKEAMKKNAPFQKEGIMSISKALTTNVDSKVNKIVEGAKRQGIDFDKYNEQEVKYILELNKPKLEPRVISADSPEGRGITKALLGRKEGKVIKADFGKPFKEEVETMRGGKKFPTAKDPDFKDVGPFDNDAEKLAEIKMSNEGFIDDIITDIKQMEPIDSMKEANKVLKGEGRYKNLSQADREKIVNDESVTDHIFERQKPDPEDMATGGRVGLKTGMSKRAFLKLMGGAAAGIGALKTGALKMFGKEGVKNLPPIKTPVTKLEGTTTQMPDWFPSFINKFRDEGKAKDVFKTKKVEVSKEEFDQAFKEGKGERYFSDVARTPEYKANNPDHMDYYKRVDTDERIYTTYTNDKVPGVQVDDMDGNVDVMFENDYSQPVSMNYTAPGKRGPETGRADIFVQGEAKLEPKPKGEFVANDVEVYATDPDGGFDTEDVIVNTVDDMLEGKTRQMEEYVTGKKTKMSSGEFRIGQAEARAEQAAEEAAEAADDFASGGRVGLLSGGGVLRVILQNLAEQYGKKPSELLAVTNYKSLPAEVRKFLTKEQFQAIKKDMQEMRIEQFKNLRDMVENRQQFDKSREALKKMGLNISDTVLQAETKAPVPGGTTPDDLLMMEQIIKNLQMKDRKLNASGGLAGMLGE
jgi:hypothetical protein